MAAWSRWRPGLLAVLLLLSASGQDSWSVQPGPGARLPNVVLNGLTAEAATTTEALRGTPLIINFWATWCRPCRDEMTSLERLSRRLPAHAARVIGVTVDRDLNLAAEFVRTRRLTFPIYADGDKKQLQSSLQVRSLPETVLVTAEGAIAARIVGARDWNGAESGRLLERALGLRLAASD
jgi:thiol-disulfide isomerase/thioredoxin